MFMSGIWSLFSISDVLDIEQFSTVKGVNLDAKDDTFYQVNEKLHFCRINVSENYRFEKWHMNT